MGGAERRGRVAEALLQPQLPQAARAEYSVDAAAIAVLAVDSLVMPRPKSARGADRHIAIVC